ELLHPPHHGANVDERIGSSLSWLLNAHALFHNALHTQQADAELRLNQFADAAHTAVAQVINIVFAAMAIIQPDEATNNIYQIILGEDTHALRCGQVELAIQLIATDTAQIVATTIEKQ